MPISTSKADFAQPILTHLRDLIHGREPAVEEDDQMEHAVLHL